jgi:hypothetical protein
VLFDQIDARLRIAVNQERERHGTQTLNVAGFTTKYPVGTSPL